MLDKIQEIVRQVATKEVNQINEVSNDLIQDVSKETSSSVIDGFKSAIGSGNIGAITNLLKGEETGSSNDVVSSMIGSLTSGLTNKLGIDSNTSSGLAQSIIPQIMGMLFGGKNGGGVNIQEFLSSFGEDGLIMDKLKDFGLDQNGDGKLGIDDAISAVKDGKLGDMLGGFFKK